MLALLFCAALAWRLAYLHRLAATPLGGSLTEDAQFYWTWSGWLLRHGWLGARPFFLAPLYPYVLALLRIPLGSSVQAVLTVQAVWGSAAAVLLADAARRVTRPSIGLAVGLLAAFYETAVFFDGLVLTESLVFFFECVLLWWIVAHSRDARVAWVAAVAGVLVGLIAEGRATSALLMVPAVAWVVGARTRAVAPALAALAAGFLVITVPVAIRNRVVGHEWIPFTYNFGFNLYAGNSPESDGAFTTVTGNQWRSAETEALAEGGARVDGREYLRKVDGVDLSPAASSAYWARKAESWIRANPGRALALTLRKLAMMWNRREYSQIESVREYRRVAGPIGLPWIGTFFVVGPLGLAGLWLGLRAPKRAATEQAATAARTVRFAAWYLLVMTLSIAPFFVTDRYRHHLLPAVLLLTGFALAWIADTARSGNARGWLTLLVAAAPGLVLVNLPTPYLSETKYAWGEATDLGMRWSEQGRWDLAIQEYERAIAMESQHRMARVPGGVAATERADLYYDYGNALAHVGRDADAVAAYERAVAEAPDRAPALRALADWYAHAGRTMAAESLYAALSTKVGGDGLAAAGRALMAARSRRFDTAEQLFAEAVRLDPHIMDAWGGLIRLQAQRGAWNDARATLERARAAGLDDPALAAYEALLAASSGRSDEAERDLARVPASATEHDQTLADVVRVTRSMLGR